MKIISPLKAAMCALALMSPQRPAFMIGTMTIRYDLYNDGTKEYCIEDHILLGRTWVDDKRIFSVEVDMKFCEEPT